MKYHCVKIKTDRVIPSFNDIIFIFTDEELCNKFVEDIKLYKEEYQLIYFPITNKNDLSTNNKKAHFIVNPILTVLYDQSPALEIRPGVKFEIPLD